PPDPVHHRTGRARHAGGRALSAAAWTGRSRGRDGMSGHRARTEPARILVVDDTEANRDLLVRRLQREGHATEVAANGHEALEWLLAGGFDLMLLDIMMPGINGYELLERMRADADLSHVPVILISALDDSDSVIKGIELGADDHLPKP